MSALTRSRGVPPSPSSCVSPSLGLFISSSSCGSMPACSPRDRETHSEHRHSVSTRQAQALKSTTHCKHRHSVSTRQAQALKSTTHCKHRHSVSTRQAQAVKSTTHCKHRHSVSTRQAQALSWHTIAGSQHVPHWHRIVGLLHLRSRMRAIEGALTSKCAGAPCPYVKMCRGTMSKRPRCATNANACRLNISKPHPMEVLVSLLCLITQDVHMLHARQQQWIQQSLGSKRGGTARLCRVELQVAEYRV